MGSTVSRGNGSLRDYALWEARRTSRASAVAVSLGGVLAVLGSNALVPRIPSEAIRFMEQAFRVEGLASVLLVNDLLVPYFVTFFLGLGGLLDATVTAREEGQLELLLAKPIRARTFLTARTAPVLGAATAAGAAAAIAIAVTVPPLIAPDERISAAGVLGSSLFVVGAGLVLLSALLPVFVLLRERLQGVLIAAVAWLGTVMPTGYFIYRPDLFEGARSVVLLPSLLWHDHAAAWLGPLALAASVAFAAFMMSIAGRLLERADSR